ncbi:MAG TPA: HD-GYP domain-containing protein [Gaiellaceae bacterium]
MGDRPIDPFGPPPRTAPAISRSGWPESAPIRAQALSITAVTPAVDAREAVDLDPEADGLVEQSRERRLQSVVGRELLASLLAGGSFVAVTSLLLAFSASSRNPSVWTILLLVALYALVASVEFEVGAGYGVPAELVLVPMLFLLPVAFVPLAVATGIVLSEAVAIGRRRDNLQRLLVAPGNAWYAVGPVLVLLAAGEPAPNWSDWPVYLGAFAAQIGFDYGASAAREWIAFGLQPRSHLHYMGWVWAVDGALAPIGLLVAFAAVDAPAAVLLILPLVGLLALFARQRRFGIDRALELSHAYRGTAFLLGDVVEADDSYTGAHCKDVVELVLAVADKLGVDARGRRDAEFAALLHDVGKVRISKELINKPGALTREERAVIETHTIEGEQMLAQVGGLLGEVGQIVRSHHERYDGTGYPDGLAGEEIPLIARIVSCCDAFNAMTTNRPYRKALPFEEAVAELRQQAGLQFDPAVVDALVDVLEQF